MEVQGYEADGSVYGQLDEGQEPLFSQGILGDKVIAGWRDRFVQSTRWCLIA